MEKIIRQTTNKVDETKELGRNLGLSLVGGDVLLLSGELGAGKTTFLKGLAKGLGVVGAVNSPTFNILKLYKLKGNKRAKFFCHIDAYRLNGATDLLALGIQEILVAKDTVVAVEWAEKVKTAFSRRQCHRLIKLKLEHVGEDSRKITIKKYEKF